MAVNRTAAATYAGLVNEIADRYGIPRGIGYGLIDHETGGTWNPRAIRNEPQIQDASRGLTQLLYRTARGVGYTGTPDGLFNPAVNIEYGFKYLASLYRQIGGSWADAISAYNGGYRPTLGFGRVLRAPQRITLAHDPVTGRPTRWYDAQAGQYANQPYVDSVLARAAEFGYVSPTKATDLLTPKPHLPVTTPTPKTAALNGAQATTAPSTLRWLVGGIGVAALLYAFLRRLL